MNAVTESEAVRLLSLQQNVHSGQLSYEPTQELFDDDDDDARQIDFGNDFAFGDSFGGFEDGISDEPESDRREQRQSARSESGVAGRQSDAAFADAPSPILNTNFDLTQDIIEICMCESFQTVLQSSKFMISFWRCDGMVICFYWSSIVLI